MSDVTKIAKPDIISVRSAGTEGYFDYGYRQRVCTSSSIFLHFLQMKPIEKHVCLSVLVASLAEFVRVNGTRYFVVPLAMNLQFFLP